MGYNMRVTKRENLMINGRIYSDKTIDAPTRYLDAVFGSYWVEYRVIKEEELFEEQAYKVIEFTVSEECRRLCEVSRNIEVIVPLAGPPTWEDGSPVPMSDDGEIALGLRW